MKRFSYSIIAVFSVLSLSTFASAEVLDVCERTQAVQDFIVNKVNQDQGTDKTCSEITEDDLETLLRVSVAGRRINEFKAGDFSGLPNLEILNIRSNPAKTLPEGLFDGLTNLKTLVIISNGLRYYPDDFLAATPNLENCHCFANQVRSISESIFQRLEAMDSLKILDFDASLLEPEKTRLTELFPDNGPVDLTFY